MVGNHHIHMENVRSMTIRYRPKWQPLLLGDIVIENDGQRWYQVTPDSVITVVHDEHGMVTIKFNDVYKVRFRTLDLATNHDHERNTIILSMLSP